MKYFLIIYNRTTGASSIDRVFPATARAEAMRARFAAEEQYCDSPDVEVVVLGAESESNLHRTHARYFDSTRKLLSQAHGPAV